MFSIKQISNLVTKFNQGFESLAHGSGVSSPPVASVLLLLGVRSSGPQSTHFLVRLALKVTPSCVPPARWRWWAPRGLEWPGGATVAPSLSGVPVPDWCSRFPSCSSRLPLHLETTSASRRAGGGGLSQQPKVLPPPLAGARSSQPPGSGPVALLCKHAQHFGRSWVLVRGSCGGVCLSQWPTLHPRGGVGRGLEAKDVGSPRTSAASQLAQGGALC